jgi:hypothetical protein
MFLEEWVHFFDFLEILREIAFSIYFAKYIGGLFRGRWRRKYSEGY